MKNLRTDLNSKLDLNLIIQSTKRGITIIHSTYMGFDIEYEILNLKNNLNKLLSIQYYSIGYKTKNSY
jgi:hypothetical protein